MADDNRIIIEASLDPKTSTKLIQDDLDKISKDVRLKIANVSIDKSIVTGLQTELDNITKDLKLNINTKNIQQSIKDATMVMLK